MGLKDIPMVFAEPTELSMSTVYPVNIIQDNFDGTYIGTIDEDRLTTAKRIILGGELGFC